MNYYVCLLGSAWGRDAYHAGDIVAREPGVGPPGTGWAGFESPAELNGKPALMHTEDNGSGELVFKYLIAETETTFVIKAKVGLPQSVVVIVPPGGEAARDSVPPELNSEPVLRFGAGLAETSGRSCIRWAPGGAKPTPRVRGEIDLLRPPDDGIDVLRRGLE